jgi:hypothetical protein
VFREFNFLLQLLEILCRRLGRHYSAPVTNADHMEGGQAGGRWQPWLNCLTVISRDSV